MSREKRLVKMLKSAYAFFISRIQSLRVLFIKQLSHLISMLSGIATLR